MELTEKEKAALMEKLDHPNKEVLCPRCGEPLAYVERGNSVSAECPREGCIFAGIRGI